MTKYQWCLSVVAMPWLVLFFVPAKAGVVLLAWFGCMPLLTMATPQIVIIGVAVPIATISISMAASVLLLLDREIKRYEAEENDDTGVRRS